MVWICVLAKTVVDQISCYSWSPVTRVHTHISFFCLISILFLVLICTESSMLSTNWSGNGRTRPDNRWSKKVLAWRPRMNERSLERTPSRWTDDLVRVPRIRWMEAAQHRSTFTGKDLCPCSCGRNDDEICYMLCISIN